MKRLLAVSILIIVLVNMRLSYAGSLEKIPKITPSIRLSCNGDLKTVKDLDTKTQPITIYVFIDLENSVAQIKDYWGCLAEIGSQPVSTFCNGTLPVKVSDEEIFYYGQSANDLYSGSSSFTINRFSGTFSSSGVAFAKPASKATWAIINISSKLNCTLIEKQQF